MKQLAVITSVLALLVSATPATAANGFWDAKKDDYLVVFKNSTNLDFEVRSWRNKSFNVKQSFGSAIKSMVVEINPTQVKKLESDPEVLLVEADSQVSIAETTQSSAPWNLDRIDQSELPLNSEYSYQTTGSGVTIYVVDTGIMPNHVELSGRVLSGYTSISDRRGTKDCNGHGTHVAGIAAGTMFGVAKQANVVPVRVLNCMGNGTNSSVIKGLDWIASRVSPGTKAVVNMSLGGGASNALDLAVQKVINKGALVVVASGNEETDACYSSPASAPNALTVAATSRFDEFSWFANYGSCVDLLAPGEDITSGTINPLSSRTTDYFETWSGTSMAAPHVAGAAALILQSGYRTPADLAQAILGNTITGEVSYLPADTADKLLYVGESLNAPQISPSSQSIQGFVGSEISSEALQTRNLDGFELSVSPILPAELVLDLVTGKIAGVPAAPINQSFTITATSGEKSATSVVSISVANPYLTPQSQTVSGNVNSSLSSERISPTGLTGLTEFEISSEELLPAGLSFDSSNGRISGIPSVQLPTTIFTITARGSLGGVATSNLTLTVGPEIVARAPEAPKNLVATPGSRRASLSWISGNNFGFPVTGQTIKVFEVSGLSARQVSNVRLRDARTSTTVSGLRKGRTYYFTITATNFYGTSEESLVSNSVIIR